MKYRSITIASAIIAMLSVTSAVSEEQLFSLRGDNDLAALAQMFNKYEIISKKGGFPRTWKLQPPLISHNIEKDVINLDGNSCMNCHSLERYKEENAVKIGESHFITADGKKSDVYDKRRYFCTQCHVTQTDVELIVENSFSSGGN